MTTSSILISVATMVLLTPWSKSQYGSSATSPRERQSFTVFKEPACQSARDVQWMRKSWCFKTQRRYWHHSGVYTPFLSCEKTKRWIQSGYSICRRGSIQQAPALPYAGCRFHSQADCTMESLTSQNRFIRFPSLEILWNIAVQLLHSKGWSSTSKAPWDSLARKRRLKNLHAVY